MFVQQTKLLFQYDFSKLPCGFRKGFSVVNVLLPMIEKFYDRESLLIKVALFQLIFLIRSNISLMVHLMIAKRYDWSKITFLGFIIVICKNLAVEVFKVKIIIAPKFKKDILQIVKIHIYSEMRLNLNLLTSEWLDMELKKLLL